VMGRQIMDSPDLLERFLREIRAVAKLRHPNIVTAYSATRLGESIVFAMEYVEGLDLAKMVQAKGPLPVGHACNFVSQAALGLQHAHEEGLVHRDIKPGNLMLSRKGDKATVKVLDFGLAKATREGKVDGALTSAGQALGTPDYIAPEQILDATTADIRADIYSLGATLYFLLTGRPPFQANSLYDLYQAHIDDPDTPLAETLDAFQRLIDAGKVRAVGASNYSAPRLVAAMQASAAPGRARFASMQPHYNLCERGGFEGPLQAACLRNGLAVFPYWSLANGFLTGKYRSAADTAGRSRATYLAKHFTPRGMAILAALDQVGAELGATPAQVALAWLMAQPGVTAPIASATSPQQLAELVGACDLALTPTALARLDSASRTIQVNPA